MWLTLSQTTNFRLPNWKSLQTTISNLIKMEESFSNGLKTLGEKEKLVVTSNFSFSHSVYKRLVLQTHKNRGLFGKGLRVMRQFWFTKVCFAFILSLVHWLFFILIPANYHVMSGYMPKHIGFIYVSSNLGWLSIGLQLIQAVVSLQDLVLLLSQICVVLKNRFSSWQEYSLYM